MQFPWYNVKMLGKIPICIIIIIILTIKYLPVSPLMGKKNCIFNKSARHGNFYATLFISVLVLFSSFVKYGQRLEGTFIAWLVPKIMGRLDLEDPQQIIGQDIHLRPFGHWCGEMSQSIQCSDIRSFCYLLYSGLVLNRNYISTCEKGWSHIYVTVSGWHQVWRSFLVSLPTGRKPR